MKKTNPKVDAFLGTEKKWQKEFEKLRTIVLDCQLSEELKWGQLCYTLQNENIFYFTSPKQSKTRESRIENCVQKILDGKGLND